MKRILIITFIVSALLGTTGCTDWLDLKPESEILLDDYWQSEENVNAMMMSCYRGLTSSGIVSQMIVWGELRSDNLTVAQATTNYNDLGKILDANITSSNSFCSWAAYYSVINNCNTLLKYAPQVVEMDENFTPSDLHRVQSEALTIRALCYFYLVRAFKEVPLVLDASVSDAQNYQVPKQTEDVIVKQIIEDLLEAKKYAPTDFGSLKSNTGRVTLKTVNALLADVYLWSQQYDKCVAACDDVLADTKLKLVPGSQVLTQVFYLGSSTESIFELQFDQDVVYNTAVEVYYNSNLLVLPPTIGYNVYGTTKDVGVYSPFKYSISGSAIESQNDQRIRDWVIASSASNADYYTIYKFKGTKIENVDGTSATLVLRNNTPNWIIYRLSDVMLMKAEALTQKYKQDALTKTNDEQDLKSALDMVNTVYLRSNPTDDSLKIDNYSTDIEMEKLILRERQRELMFEGKRWFDLQRVARREGNTSTMNDYVDHKASGTAKSLGAPVLNAIYMPISESELHANKNLVQNPYYQITTSSSSR